MCSCTDGLGRSCLAVVLLAMYLDSDLPPMVAMEIVQRARGPAAIQTIKVCIYMYNHVFNDQQLLHKSKIVYIAVTAAREFYYTATWVWFMPILVSVQLCALLSTAIQLCHGLSEELVRTCRWLGTRYSDSS